MAEGQGLGKDLKLKFERAGADLAPAEGDLDTVSGDDNLAQALIHRLTTEQGELDDIGHADYGSRLYEMVGEPNSEGTRAMIRNLVDRCLSEEPRVAEVRSVRATANAHDPTRVDIEITVVPVGSDGALTVVYPFRLEVE